MKKKIYVTPSWSWDFIFALRDSYHLDYRLCVVTSLVRQYLKDRKIFNVPKSFLISDTYDYEE